MTVRPRLRGLAPAQYNRPMAGGMDSKYLKDLQHVLEAEAALARKGVDLLADPEYRALRELFIDGDMTVEEFVGRVEGLAAIRPEDDEDDDGAGNDPTDPESEDDLGDLEDVEDLQVLKELKDLDGTDDPKE
jgi:hypothetical protein